MDKGVWYMLGHVDKISMRRNNECMKTTNVGRGLV